MKYLVLSAVALSSLVAHGQGKDLQDAMEAKRLVEETDAYEKSKRAELEKKIKEERNRALEALKRLAKKYKDKGERSEAREIRKAISALEKELGNTDLAEQDEPDPESDVFEYGKEYAFKSGKIQGTITFMANGNANIIYNLEGSPQNLVWKFEEKSDHVLISDGGDLGRIYVSEVPKSDKRSIMIRWGGKLRHSITTATRK